jgi:hypothetical protein
MHRVPELDRCNRFEVRIAQPGLSTDVPSTHWSHTAGRPVEAQRITDPPLTTATFLLPPSPPGCISFISDLERARTGFDFRTRPFL